LVIIRLKRMGSKGQPSFRIVAADRRKAPGGKFLESFGYYDPLRKPMEVKIDEERVFHWLDRGAQVSDTVRNLLKKTGTWSKWHKLSSGDKEVKPEVVFIKGQSKTS